MHLTPIAFIVAIAITSTVPPTQRSQPDSEHLARIAGQGVVESEVERRFDRALATIDRHCLETRKPARGESSIADIVLSATTRLQGQGKTTSLITFTEAWALAVEGFPPTSARECVDVAAALVLTIEESH
jgi:hypothetical protein